MYTSSTPLSSANLTETATVAAAAETSTEVGETELLTYTGADKSVPEDVTFIVRIWLNPDPPFPRTSLRPKYCRLHVPAADPTGNVTDPFQTPFWTVPDDKRNPDT